MKKIVVAAVLMLLAVPSVCLASVPEIDVSAAPGAIAFLGGALLVLRGWRKR
jgi:hypothetical protein